MSMLGKLDHVAMDEAASVCGGEVPCVHAVYLLVCFPVAENNRCRDLYEARPCCNE